MNFFLQNSPDVNKYYCLQNTHTLSGVVLYSEHQLLLKKHWLLLKKHWLLLKKNLHKTARIAHTSPNCWQKDPLQMNALLWLIRKPATFSRLIGEYKRPVTDDLFCHGCIRCRLPWLENCWVPLLCVQTLDCFRTVHTQC